MMRRLIVVVPLLLAVATLPVAGAGKIALRTTITGKISALGLTSVTIRGDRKLTCRVGALSPRGLGYVLGSGARITCVNGLLTKIVDTDRPLPSNVTTGPQNSAGTSLSFIGVLGTITALSTTSVAIGGISCTVASSSPDLSSYAVGDRVTAGCSNGTLTSIRPAS